MTDAPGVVEEYLARMVAHDWDAMAACLTPTVTRVGPFGDTYTPRDRYIAFLSKLLPSLEGYSMHVSRVLYRDGVALAQLSETVDLDGVATETREALVFDLDDNGLIDRIEIFIQRVANSETTDE
jgi:hypothetical protein